MKDEVQIGTLTMTMTLTLTMTVKEPVTVMFS